MFKVNPCFARRSSFHLTFCPDDFKRILPEEEFARPAQIFLPEVDGLISGDLLAYHAGGSAGGLGHLETKGVSGLCVCSLKWVTNKQLWLCT